MQDRFAEVGYDTRCRWFVLKHGKIFWFKSDVVRPVSLAWSVCLFKGVGAAFWSSTLAIVMISGWCAFLYCRTHSLVASWRSVGVAVVDGEAFCHLLQSCAGLPPVSGFDAECTLSRCCSSSSAAA